MVTFQFPHGGVGRRPRFPVRPSSLSFYRDTHLGKATSGSQGRVKCVIKRVCAVHTITGDTEERTHFTFQFYYTHPIPYRSRRPCGNSLKCQMPILFIDTFFFTFPLPPMRHVNDLINGLSSWAVLCSFTYHPQVLSVLSLSYLKLPVKPNTP